MLSFTDKLVFGVVFGGLILLILLVAVSIPICLIQSNRIMAECMADGHKEYECVSMLRGRR